MHWTQIVTQLLLLLPPMSYIPGPGVPESQISPNPGLEILFHFCISPLYALLRVTFSVIITKSWSKDTTSVLKAQEACC